ncbi:MAG: hypothetical protein NWE76_07175 [Candidatus Bathyarchaeota archaeon]|nr:hypothetical protein [Candidatus Bathyarchaeota archaeon]
MQNKLLEKLADKSLTTEDLLQKVKQDPSLLARVIDGVSSSRAAIRYGCAKVLVVLSEKVPEMLYPHMGYFVDLLGSKYRILIWNATAIIANLTRVDRDKKFDAVIDKYYGLLDDEYMVTVANVVGHSGKIALAKPYLVPRITKELLRVESISVTPHLTEECRRVIAEKAIKSLSLFFDRIDDKEEVVSFVERQLGSSRKSLRSEAKNFLKKWG